MVRLLIALVCLQSALAQDLFLAQYEKSQNAQKVSAVGGIPCIACGLVLTLATEDGHLKQRLEDSLDKACNTSAPCKAAVEKLVNYLEAKVSPDKICSSVTLCDATCQLFPEQWPVGVPDAPPQDPPNTGRRLSNKDSLFTPAEAAALKSAFTAAGFQKSNNKLTDGGNLGAMAAVGNVIRKLHGDNVDLDDVIQEAATRAAAKLPSTDPCSGNPVCIIKRFTDEHLPIFDSDADGFGPVIARGLRGSHWRGADCDEKSSDVYPGRRTTSSDVSVDHDCNGISGGNASGSFEELFCSETPRRGLIHIGDSATAHFHVPPQWLSINSSGWNLDNVIADAVDELDQPACAWGTGYRNASQCPWGAGQSTMSIAARLRQRNRCNHRDFQNIGVNGARVGSTMPLVKSASRNTSLDHPALVIFSLIGNDVCNGHPGTSHMTPPDHFRESVLASLAALDAKLPSGSAVLMVGLVDGRVLYDTMHAVQHPAGPNYREIYGYLNCNEQTPCLGWLNSNETFRNITTEWAMSLNAEYEKIIASGKKYTNFDLDYFNPDWHGIIQNYVNQGGRAEDVIERIDGFHPSQLGNGLLAETIWKHLETKFPQALGDVNPHNAEIEKLFGDQGGF